MLLANYYYLVVSYFLTIWIQRPFIVTFVFLVFQSIWGVIFEPPIDEIFGWQALITLSGVITGLVFLVVVKPPFMLVWRDGYFEIWVKFLLSTALFILAIIPYSIWLPPVEPWGILLSSLLTPIVIIITWLSIYWIDHLWEKCKNINFFFLYWAFTTSVMGFSFYLINVIDERWTTFAAALITILVILTASLFCPYHIHIKSTANKNDQVLPYNK